MKQLSVLLAAAALAVPAFAQSPHHPTAGYIAPPTFVTAQRSAEDERITSAVMERIAADPLISGHVAVDTIRNVVMLSGRVATPVQAERATRHAMLTRGVVEVDNQLRSHPGA